jgi:hypothetical protein
MMCSRFGIGRWMGQWLSVFFVRRPAQRAAGCSRPIGAALTPAWAYKGLVDALPRMFLKVQVACR